MSKLLKLHDLACAGMWFIMDMQIVAALVGAGAGTIGGWLIAFAQSASERKRAKASEAAAEIRADKAETELREYRRRGDAPFFVPDETRFEWLWYDQTDGNQGRASVEGGCILWAGRSEVKRDGGDNRWVFFPIANRGSEARQIKVTLAGDGIAAERESDSKLANGLFFFSYPYDPKLHGKEQVIEVWFEAASGRQDTHKYQTKHGYRALERIDPK